MDFFVITAAAMFVFALYNIYYRFKVISKKRSEAVLSLESFSKISKYASIFFILFFIFAISDEFFWEADSVEWMSITIDILIIYLFTKRFFTNMRKVSVTDTGIYSFEYSIDFKNVEKYYFKQHMLNYNKYKCIFIAKWYFDLPHSKVIINLDKEEKDKLEEFLKDKLKNKQE